MSKRENLSLGMKTLVDFIHNDNNKRREARGYQDMCYCVHYPDHGIRVWQKDSKWIANPEPIFKIANAFNLDIIITTVYFHNKDVIALSITD